jgi:hypothetical protein
MALHLWESNPNGTPTKAKEPNGRCFPDLRLQLLISWKNRIGTEQKKPGVFKMTIEQNNPLPSLLRVLVSVLLLLTGVNAGETTSQDGPEAEQITEVMAQGLLDEIVPEVERIRGLAFDHAVPVRVISDDEAQQHMINRLDLFDVPARTKTMQRAYRLLGLLPEDVDMLQAFLDVLREQAGGFYDPETKSFFLLDDIPVALIKVLMAHELTHALEDQKYDLDAGLHAVVEDDDRLFALSAVHEGSATLLMTIYMSEQAMQGAIDAETLAAVSEADFGGGAALANLPPVMMRQLLGPYLLGLNFLTRGMTTMAKGYPVADVASACTASPSSSEQILHPERYWDEATRDEPLAIAPFGAEEALGDEWKPLGTGVLGELTIGVMVGASTPSVDAAVWEGSSAWTNAAADGWGGDRWELWSHDDIELALLRTVWDSVKDAREFAKALQEHDRFKVVRSGRKVLIAAGGSRQARSALLKATSGATGQH